MRSNKRFLQDQHPATQMRMRGRRTPIRCCACRDCNFGPDSYSRTREKREWRSRLKW